MDSYRDKFMRTCNFAEQGGFNVRTFFASSENKLSGKGWKEELLLPINGALEVVDGLH